ncbi:MAG: metal ABC transporter substrate-binding protein [Lachnospiraceae bacterium]|nr:metal ABC transporter substrate-binding protein [Lachnospiraceae bacterium]
MKNKYVFVVVMLCVILVAGMGFTNLYVNYSEGDTSKEGLTVVTSFYPMYVAAMNVVGDAPGVKLQNLSEPQTGCLHDFQLTPEDMKLLSTADVFIINGGGIEAFMEDVAKAYPNLTIVSTCEYLELLSDGDETNAHAWMSVGMYREMVQTIAMGLAKADPDNRALYEENAEIYDSKLMRLEERQQTVAEAAEGTDVILFHEAYDYVADDYGMQVSCVMDLDEERQVSAGEVSEVLRAINEDGASLILAEELYGKSMAETVQKEADVSVIYLDPLNRGDYEADSYLLGMAHNIELLEAYFVK